MKMSIMHQVRAQLIDDTPMLTLADLCRSCGVSHITIETWVLEGILLPSGTHPDDWRFNDSMLRRARLAQQMADDMELNPAGIALALDLLDQIDALRTQLTRMGAA